MNVRNDHMTNTSGVTVGYIFISHFSFIIFFTFSKLWRSVKPQAYVCTSYTACVCVLHRGHWYRPQQWFSTTNLALLIAQHWMPDVRCIPYERKINFSRTRNLMNSEIRLYWKLHGQPVGYTVFHFKTKPNEATQCHIIIIEVPVRMRTQFVLTPFHCVINDIFFVAIFIAPHKKSADGGEIMHAHTETGQSAVLGDEKCGKRNRKSVESTVVCVCVCADTMSKRY